MHNFQIKDLFKKDVYLDVVHGVHEEDHGVLEGHVVALLLHREEAGGAYC